MDVSQRRYYIQRKQVVDSMLRDKKRAQRMEQGLPVDYSVSPIEKSRAKVVKSGNKYEVYIYEKPVTIGVDRRGTSGRGEGTSERKEENRKLTMRRARENIRRLLNANFTNKDKFVTLTFKDQPAVDERHSYGEDERNRTEIDIKNVKETNKEFKKFVQRLRRYVKKIGGDDKFHYLAAIEFQDKNGRGAVHYHMMVQLPYIPNKVLADIWRHGFVKINAIDHVDNIGAYISKYLMKDMEDERLFGEKAYLLSKGMKKPEEFRGELAHRMVQDLEREQKKVYDYVYPSEWFGHVNYKEYNTGQNEVYRKQRKKNPCRKLGQDGNMLLGSKNQKKSEGTEP